MSPKSEKLAALSSFVTVVLSVALNVREFSFPAMTKDFKKYDAKRFAKFGCKTCHGKGGEKGGDFKMPNPDLPVLDFEAIKAGKQDPKMAKWMGEVVKPEMAKLLGLEPWDEQHPTGFGCNACHMIKAP